MRDEVAGRLLRMVRLRKRWTQAEVSRRARISIASVSRLERGELGRHRLEIVQRHAAALELRAEINLIGRGGEVDRILDREHAAIAEWTAAILADSGWTVVAEASFSIYGERGRIDLLAHHSASRTLLIVEVKTAITDLQQLHGSIDVRERLAPALARDRGWDVGTAATLVALADTHGNRSIVRRHAALFASFERHGARIRQWLQHPRSGVGVRFLLYVAPARARQRDWLATRRRVRLPIRPS